MVSEREFRFACAIDDILQNHRNWPVTVDPQLVIAELTVLLGNDHVIAARLWFDALRAIEEYNNGSN